MHTDNSTASLAASRWSGLSRNCRIEAGSCAAHPQRCPTGSRLKTEYFEWENDFVTKSIWSFIDLSLTVSAWNLSSRGFLLFFFILFFWVSFWPNSRLPFRNKIRFDETAISQYHWPLMLEASRILVDRSQPAPLMTCCRSSDSKRHTYQVTDLVCSTSGKMGFPTVHQNHRGKSRPSPPACLGVLAPWFLLITYK